MPCNFSKNATFSETDKNPPKIIIQIGGVYYKIDFREQVRYQEKQKNRDYQILLIF